MTIERIGDSPNGELLHNAHKNKTNELVDAANADTVDLGLVTTLSDFGGLLSVTNNDTGINSLVIAGDEIQAEGIKKPNVPTAGPLETIYSQFIDADTSQPYTEASTFVNQVPNFLFTSVKPSTEYIPISTTFDLATIPPSGQVLHEVWRGLFVKELWSRVIDVTVGVNTISPPENHPVTYRDSDVYYTRTTPVGGGSFSLKGDQPGEIFSPMTEIKGYAVQRSTLLTEADIPSQTVARSFDTQTVLVHNILDSATEVVVNFGTSLSDDFSIVNGVAEVLTETNETQAFIEIHLNKVGALDAVFHCWLEASPDDIVWSAIPESMRSEVIDKDGESNLLFDFSFNVFVQVGGFFRIVSTNTGAVTLTMEKPADLVTTNGTASGFAKKLRLIKIK